ncbi:class I SAM-dependent methyltransferase [Desulfurivibrio alkaliphilus]|uniref:Methyltransferase type 11 n=1 Tax=Desulfurivibrio alkaliphilus (strain DSM 19089 / UNIQEM U267 / AHT2) TaxID=589865 RepID=D6Z5R6_DESAT|nr:class I SAM-dependent methyltransferase [Desulfurivibrio alkaliphilus]ADH86803.1 Methyltransferase type 11 [Desulfurivibrio alkaliphilus AHT 2]
MQDTNRLYTDLAWLWPLWGDVATEYAHYCRHVSGLIKRHGQLQSGTPPGTLLVIGCGGGKNVFNLKGEFSVTGVDLSPVMLAQARKLNPECTFIQGDMRSFRLADTFDAVLMDDAISHMNCLDDFTAALQTAHAHLKPGGVLIVTPDVTTENFRQNHTTVSPAAPGTAPPGLEVVFVENIYDPDPSDQQYEATILYIIRDQGRLRIETDHWTLGLFSLNTWRRVLHETGFTVHEGSYYDGEDEYTVFACAKNAEKQCTER